MFSKQCSGGPNSGQSCSSSANCGGYTCQESSTCTKTATWSCTDEGFGCYPNIPETCRAGTIQGTCSSGGGGGTAAVCGNGSCQSGETAANCPADCANSSGGGGGGTTQGWGACGSCSCSSIGVGTGSQCRLNDHGTCVWDPGGCGGGSASGEGCRYPSMTPTHLTLNPGDAATVTYSVFADASPSYIHRVYFSTFDTAVVTRAPAFTNTCCGWIFGRQNRSFTVTAVAPGTTNVRGMIDLGSSQGTLRCAAYTQVTVVAEAAVCGDSTCDSGESCSSCTADCGVCVGGGGGGEVCGNSTCESGETCSSCSADCGACAAAPTVVLRANGSAGSVNLPYNSAVTLTWDSSNATTCTALAGSGFSGSKSADGSQAMGNLTATQQYQISCSGAGGTATSMVTVNVSACSPTCTSPLCGQADGCGGLCDDNDDLEPPAPAQIDPTNNEIVTAYDSSSGGPTKAVNIQIRTQPDTDYNAYYTYLELYPEGTNCSHSLARCQVVGTNVPKNTLINYVYHIPVASYGSHYRYQWRVRHQNNTCTSRIGTFSSWRYFDLHDELIGYVYKDDGYAGFSGNSCISPFSGIPITPEGGETVTVSRNGQDYTGSVQPDGSYSVSAPITNAGQNQANYNSANPLTDVCGCPGGCLYPTANLPSTLNFYYLLTRDPWWQVENGHIYTREESGIGVSSVVPDTCIGVCRPYVSVRDSADRQDSSGIIVTGGGTIDTSNTPGNQTNQVDEDGRNYRPSGTGIGGVLENYAHFYRLFSMGVNPADDFGITAGDAQKPSSAPSNARAYFRNGDLTIQDPWSLGTGESIVVFVSGSLNIQNTITVDQGGFLAFVVEDSINIAPTVCQSDHESTAGVVEGVFIADDSINIQGNANGGDCRFVGEGIFAGWGGIQLDRDFNDDGIQEKWNTLHAVEYFRYRPDFVANVAELMTKPVYQWQEVAP